MRAWKESEGQDYAPSKIVYLLEHECPDAQMSALKGADANKVAVLHTLSPELGFRLGFASISHSLYRRASDYGARNGYCIDTLERCETQIYLVDINGKMIENDSDSELELSGKETIPADLDDWDRISGGSYVEEDYDPGSGYPNDGTLTREYECTALVIWPNEDLSDEDSDEDASD
ncbi:hypothetical protein EUX98_g8640 [Antrodiella citrinella]|uniref:Uncharacterized protein n=1 Tax=Antrodiella citrinella TaxID=2447956 RepID=A0A4S4M597_9APHY|nr:hypothetical protein EUX98_g8640 [Antrodiella citrinella]